MNALTFLQSVTGYTQSNRQSSADMPIRIATIDPAYNPFASYPAVAALPQVTFDGESSLTTKRYAVVAGFIPAPSQRVWMVPIGNTYLVCGGVQNDEIQGQYSNVAAGTSQIVANELVVANKSVGRGVILGNYYTGADRATGIAGTEAVCNMETGTAALIGGRLYHILAKIKVTGSVTGDEWIFRVRQTNLAGTVIGEYVWKNPNSIYGWSHPALSFQYLPSVNESKTFVLTAQRLAGTGTLAVNTGGTTNHVYMEVEDKGKANVLTVI